MPRRAPKNASPRAYGTGSIKQRSKGHWGVTVEFPRDPVTGKRRRRRFTVQGNKGDAQQALTDALHERDHGGVDPNRITTGDWLTTCLDQRVKDGAVGPRTGETYRGIIKTHLAPTIGHVLLQDLRAAHIRALKDKLLESKSPLTARKVLGVLRQALTRAVTDGLLARDPASGVPNPSVGRVSRERRALDKEEITELLRVAEGTPYATVIRFAIATGAREAEVLGATWDVVDLDGRTFRVLQTVQYMEGKFLILPPKTQNGLRTIELSETTVRCCAIIASPRTLHGAPWALSGRISISCSRMHAVSISTAGPSIGVSASWSMGARSRTRRLSTSTR